MCWRNSLLVVVLLLAACREQEPRPPVAGASPVEETGYYNPAALIEASELMSLAGADHIRVIDFRKRSDFDQGHIPGAIPMWRGDIESEEQPVPGMIASREFLGELLSGFCISSEDTLGIYDDEAGVNAARLWWALRVYGFEKVRLLNGGLQSWDQNAIPLSLQYERNPPGRFAFSGPGFPGLRMEQDSVMAVLGLPDWVVLDVRTTDEFTGRRRKEGAASAGRIPGSRHIDWAEAVNFNGDRKFRPLKELEKIYETVPDDRDTPVITYCHSGVRSAHTTFVLTQLMGYRQVHNYDGSWQEWSSIEGAPIEKDSITSILN